MQKTETYILSDSIDKPGILNEISKAYTVIKERTRNREQCLYDTFDWRLYNKGFTLVREATLYRLNSVPKDRALAASSMKSRIQPRFWWEFPDGPLKEMLKSCLSVRALLPLAKIQAHSQTLRILNQDEKTVLQIHLDDLLVGDVQPKRRLACNVRLQPVRGYEMALHEFRVFLHKLGLRPEKVNEFAIVLEATGKQPGDYSSKLKLSLSPEWPGNVAAKKIFVYLLNVMRQNEEGIIGDVDTEFLHDFRVAIRRTRSALTQIKGVLPEAITERYKRDFANLGKLTSRLRDLDVYLLKEDEYRNMLPEDLGSHLEPVFETMRRERKREHQKLVRALTAAAYRRTIESWQDFLSQPEAATNDAAKNSNKPVLGLASKFIWKKYSQVVALGQAITDASPDPELHNLRIECKKLRYLLEFFASLFPEKKITNIIKQVKKLQDNLGEFNDLYVQQKHLTEFLNSGSKNEIQQSSVAAIGGLTALLFQRQQVVRQAFAQALGQFSNPGTAALFGKLMSSDPA